MTKLETAYLAGGCFWCITPTFKEMDGVTDVVSGYSGGDEPNPTYKDVKEQKQATEKLSVWILTLKKQLSPNCLISF